LYGDDDAPASACPRVMYAGGHRHMHVSTCVPVCGRAPAHILLTAVFHHAHGRCVFASAQAYRSPCTPAASSSMSEKSSTLLGPVATGARPPAHRLCCSSQSSPTSSLDMLPIGIRDGPISPPSDTAVIRSPILLYPVRRAEDDAVVMRSAFVMRSAPSQELPVSLCKPRRARRTAPVRPRHSHLLHRTPQDKGNHTHTHSVKRLPIACIVHGLWQRDGRRVTAA